MIQCFISCISHLFQLYEEEKTEKERLKRDLEYCKKELREAKTELDRQMKRNDANRVSETNDKRVRILYTDNINKQFTVVKMINTRDNLRNHFRISNFALYIGFRNVRVV